MFNILRWSVNSYPSSSMLVRDSRQNLHRRFMSGKGSEPRHSTSDNCIVPGDRHTAKCQRDSHEVRQTLKIKPISKALCPFRVRVSMSFYSKMQANNMRSSMFPRRYAQAQSAPLRSRLQLLQDTTRLWNECRSNDLTTRDRHSCHWLTNRCWCPKITLPINFRGIVVFSILEESSVSTFSRRYIPSADIS